MSLISGITTPVLQAKKKKNDNMVVHCAFIMPTVSKELTVTMTKK